MVRIVHSSLSCNLATRAVGPFLRPASSTQLDASVPTTTNQTPSRGLATVGRRDSPGTVQGQTFLGGDGSQAGDEGWENMAARLGALSRDAEKPG